MPNPYYIAISGIMGSGKSTLAEGLSSNFGWELAHPVMNSDNYLSDLFKDMDRWAFEVQISFLTNKAFTIIQLLEQNKNFILDRSLYEDSLIFVNYFYSKNKIDQRGYMTYNNLFEHFNKSIKAPDILIHCDCDLETVKQRIEKRHREFQKYYPNNHLEDINNMYRNWMKDFRLCPFYKINTVKYDLRDKKTMLSVTEEISDLLKSRYYSQLSLFDTPIFELNLNYLEPIYPIHKFENNDNPTLINIKPRKYFTPAFPFAYIAAPFTVKAVQTKNKKSDNFLFNTEPIHGLISSKSEFRKMLNGIVMKLKLLRINSLLPHRDVSKWGNKYVSPNEVFEACTQHVTNCSLFIGIVGESNGSHYELGLAYALKKPVIIIKCAEIDNSYISEGITENLNTIKILKCSKIEEIPKLISSNEFREFLIRNKLLYP